MRVHIRFSRNIDLWSVFQMFIIPRHLEWLGMPKEQKCLKHLYSSQVLWPMKWKVAFVQNYAIARWNFADLGSLLELFTRYLQFRNAIYVMNLFQSPNLFPLNWNYDRARACKCILKLAVFYASDLFRDTIIRKVWLRLQTCHGDFLWLTFCNSVHLVSCSFQNTFFSRFMHSSYHNGPRLLAFNLIGVGYDLDNSVGHFVVIHSFLMTIAVDSLK